MPLGRKHLRRNRDAPICRPLWAEVPQIETLGTGLQRTASNLSRTGREVNVPKELDAAGRGKEAGFSGWPASQYRQGRAVWYQQSPTSNQGLWRWRPGTDLRDRDAETKGSPLSLLFRASRVLHETEP